MAEGSEQDGVEPPAHGARGRANNRVTQGGAGLERRETLSHDEWDALVRLWADVARFPLGHAEQATRHALQRLLALLGGSVAGVTLVVRTDAPRDRYAIDGWRPVLGIAMGADGSSLDEVVEPLLKQRSYADDPLVRLTLSEAGRRRAYLRGDVLDDDRFWSSPIAATLEAFGSSDRLLAMQPLSLDVEAVFSIDRPAGAARYSARERKLVLEALRGLEPLLVSLARWAGYLDCREPLTPKERRVLTELLTGRREADIAAELAMGRRSLHQRVVDVYRKFGVSSRPQLMALWLSSSPD